MVGVEGGCGLIESIEDDCSRPVLVSTGYSSDECISQEVGAEAPSLYGSVKSKSGNQQHGDRIRLAAPKP